MNSENAAVLDERSGMVFPYADHDDVSRGSVSRDVSAELRPALLTPYRFTEEHEHEHRGFEGVVGWLSPMPIMTMCRWGVCHRM